MKLLDISNALLIGRRVASFFEDFHGEDTTQWTTTASNAGLTTMQDQVNGVIDVIASDGTAADNDETYLLRTNESFLFAQNKSCLFEAFIQYAEANTDDANVMVGLMDAVAADSILDNGGGPKASYSGMVLFKVDGGTLWQAESSIAGTQETSSTTITAGGAAFQRLRIESRPLSSTLHDVLFFVDDIEVAKHKDQVFTSATEMQAFVAVKNGGANLETVSVDYISAQQLR